MTLEQQVGDLLLGQFDVLGTGGRGHNVTDIGRSLKTLHAGSIGHDDDVVLTAAKGAIPLFGKHTDDPHGNPFDPDHAIDGVFLAKEVVGHNLAQDRHLGGRPDIIVEQESALHDIPIADLGITHIGTGDLGVPILVLKNHLGIALGHGADRPDRSYLARNLASIVDRQRRSSKSAAASPSAGGRSRKDHHGVGSQTGDGCFHRLLSPRANGQHGDHRGNPDDDPQSGQKGAELIAQESPNGNLGHHPESHGASSTSKFCNT